MNQKTKFKKLFKCEYERKKSKYFILYLTKKGEKNDKNKLRRYSA